MDDENDNKLAAAMEEWGAVGSKEIDPQAAIPYVIVPQCSRIITFEEAAELIVDSVNMDDYRVSFHTSVPLPLCSHREVQGSILEGVWSTVHRSVRDLKKSDFSALDKARGTKERLEEVVVQTVWR